MALLSWSHAAIQGTIIITIMGTVLIVTWVVWWPGEAVPVLMSSTVLPCQCRVRAAPADWEMCGVSLMSNADSGAGRSNEAEELENIQWRDTPWILQQIDRQLPWL